MSLSAFARGNRFDFYQPAGQWQRDDLHRGARRFFRLLGTAEKRRVAFLQPGKVELAALGWIAHQEYPQLHHI
jgi:hypothetical protein